MSMAGGFGAMSAAREIIKQIDIELAQYTAAETQEALLRVKALAENIVKQGENGWY